MAERKWTFLYNPFLNATEGSRKKANIIDSHHYAALDNDKTDPLIAPIHTRYETEHNSWGGLYSGWIAKKGLWHGKGLIIDALIDDLTPDKLDDWEAEAVMAVGKTSNEYQTAFAGGRAPYGTGGKDQLIANVKALAERMAPFAALDTLRGKVEGYHQLMKDARDAQQAAEQASKNANDAIETARIALCKLLYGNLGLLMDIHRDNPDNIGQYFPLEVIRKGSETDEEDEETPIDTVMDTVAAATQKTAYNGNFTTITKVQIMNTGSVALVFFLTPNENDPAGPTIVTVNAGETVMVNITDLGDPTHQWLNVRNDDASNAGEYTLTLLA